MEIRDYELSPQSLIRLLVVFSFWLTLNAATVAAASADDLPALCAPTPHLQREAGCPDLGPSAYMREAAAAGLVFPLPALEVTATLPYRGLTPHAYGRVITDTAPVYRHPLEALAGLPPARRFERGFVFVSLLGSVTVDGQTFYRINPGEYMRAEDVREARPSSFAGQFFTAPPAGKVGWLINTVQVSATPGAPPAPDAPFVGRYQYVTPLNVQRVGEWDWYEIGPGQWVEQRNLALVAPTHPAGTPPDVIAVDTYEQSLGVYRGGNLIFATLASSGSRWFPTRPGTFKVWAKFTYGRMTGVYRDDRSDYYFLEDVPWILYYDGDRALHGAYWHDNFGVRTSHGCVNLSPRDARWLFNFANIGDTVVVFSSR
ncbi:MAG: L,D-transpeptidase [Anaerolineales bacterium]|nr:L,D-transpeptidase [Anaerolineales bacterium]